MHKFFSLSILSFLLFEIKQRRMGLFSASIYSRVIWERNSLEKIYSSWPQGAVSTWGRQTVMNSFDVLSYFIGTWLFTKNVFPAIGIRISKRKERLMTNKDNRNFVDRGRWCCVRSRSTSVNDFFQQQQQQQPQNTSEGNSKGKQRCR